MTGTIEVPVRGVRALGAYAVVSLEPVDGLVVGRPGQFAMVRDPDGGTFLPRPVGLFRDDHGPAILVDPAHAVGRIGEARRLRVLSPLGQGFDVGATPPDATLLVAGGIGITVFPGIAARRLVAGFRTAQQAAATSIVDAPATVRLAPALVTDELDLDAVELVLASGPKAMVKAVAALAAARGIPCQVALEAPMACGFGACYGCAVELDGEWKRLCLEGPAVDAGRLG